MCAEIKKKSDFSEKRKIDKEKNPEKYKNIGKKRWNKIKSDEALLNKKREYNKKYYNEHRETILKKSKMKRESNIEEMLLKEKEARECKTEEQKIKTSLYMREYYNINRDKITTYKNERYNYRKHIIFEFLEGKQCGRCGDNNTKHLVFHHIDPTIKEGTISSKLTGSIEKLLEEIYKCEILCANCHVKLHQENRKSKQTKIKFAQRFIRDYKELVGCEKCGETNGACLHYHHINNECKNKILSEIRNVKEAIKEIEKCVVLCANCHGELRK